MFAIIATKPLYDGTKGFRFNILGKKGLLRKRKFKSRAFSIVKNNCMTGVHMGKISLYVEHKHNTRTIRMFRHFAG